MEKDNSKRKIWSHEETLLFLNCYAARKEEFQHVRKKKYAFANVLEDMASQGLKDTSMTQDTLVTKLRSLLRAFKAAKDSNSRTGGSTCFAPYVEIMEEIFGDKPLISSHTLNSAEQVAVDPLLLTNLKDAALEVPNDWNTRAQSIQCADHFTAFGEVIAGNMRKLNADEASELESILARAMYNFLDQKRPASSMPGSLISRMNGTTFDVNNYK